MIEILEVRAHRERTGRVSHHALLVREGAEVHKLELGSLQITKSSNGAVALVASGTWAPEPLITLQAKRADEQQSFGGEGWFRRRLRAT